tara:strand:+ start:4093 stop:4494 length:402 start_codon:yes stop_codon:yes gene_type:complete
MKVVVDSNRIIAALIRDSTTREILFKRTISFITPEFLKEEVIKYQQDIIKKAKITPDEFNLLFSSLLKRMTIVPKSSYDSKISFLEGKIDDLKDIPYLACAISHKAEGIWTHDPHFQEQKLVKIFSNIDLVGV